MSLADDRAPVAPTAATAMQASSDAAAVEAPEDRAGWWSRLTYAWIGPLLTNGSQESLSANALPQLGHKQRAAVTDERFKKGWAQQLTRRKLQWCVHSMRGATLNHV